MFVSTSACASGIHVMSMCVDVDVDVDADVDVDVDVGICNTRSHVRRVTSGDVCGMHR